MRYKLEEGAKVLGIHNYLMHGVSMLIVDPEQPREGKGNAPKGSEIV